jgi:glucuronoarabinoxylan endo-1,4-beta-xylanase
MRRSSRTAPFGPIACLICSALLAAACANGETAVTGTGGSGPEGGSTGAGGEGTGGSTGNGGRGAGGVSPTGGITGSGGAPATGGSTGSGGVGPGGATGRAGSGAAGSGPGGATGGGGNGPGGATGKGGGASGGATGSGGSGIVSSGTCGGGSAASGDVTLNLASLQQRISGFGVSTAWGSSMSASDAALLWSTTTGAGLSLHRVRIDYTNGHTSEVNIAKMAVGYGVTVWATPWTPPVADKSNNNAVEGTLTNGAAFATFLTGFVSWMKSQGVPIYAVSAQNEPDANVTYESCVYTGATMDSFITSYMGPAFAGSGVKIIAPETQNWCGFANFEPTLVKNSNVAIIATHEYGCSPKAYPDIAAAGKEFWETEIYDTNIKSGEPTMASPLRVAKLINDAMTIANMNAWHYWWVYSSADGLFTGAGAPTKRLWVEGNYARFVRPGFQRVATSGTVPSGVLLSAYTNPADGTVAVVAINNNSGSTPISFYLAGMAPCSLTPWVTDASNDLASKSAITISGGRFSTTLGGQSVTTFVGKP